MAPICKLKLHVFYYYIIKMPGAWALIVVSKFSLKNCYINFYIFVIVYIIKIVI